VRVSDPLDRLVDENDLDGLLRRVEDLCDRREWDELVRLRDRSRAAVERGFQLWPAASYAEYRLALEAPGEWAGAVLLEGAGHFALGPLPEVAASTHTWGDLAPYLPGGPPATTTAHERVLRGEDLTGVEGLTEVFEVPLALQAWEPAYALATYEAEKAEFPPPPLPELLPVRFGEPGRIVDDPTVRSALADVTRTWASESNGRVETVAVEGDAASAVAALGLRSGRMAEITPAEGIAHLAWAGASGGAHGRRRGAAAGRARAWWALTCLVGLAEVDPVDPAELGEAASTLDWLWWDGGEPETGWTLHLAVADPHDGLAWALTAIDAKT
jgi:hypothetical protein